MLGGSTAQEAIAREKGKFAREYLHKAESNKLHTALSRVRIKKGTSEEGSARYLEEEGYCLSFCRF